MLGSALARNPRYSLLTVSCPRSISQALRPHQIKTRMPPSHTIRRKPLQLPSSRFSRPIHCYLPYMLSPTCVPRVAANLVLCTLINDLPPTQVWVLTRPSRYIHALCHTLISGTHLMSRAAKQQMATPKPTLPTVLATQVSFTCSGVSSSPASPTSAMVLPHSEFSPTATTMSLPLPSETCNRCSPRTTCSEGMSQNEIEVVDVRLYSLLTPRATILIDLRPISRPQRDRALSHITSCQARSTCPNGPYSQRKCRRKCAMAACTSGLGQWNWQPGSRW